MTTFPMISLRHPRAQHIVDQTSIEIAGVGTGFEGTLQVRVRGHDGTVPATKHFQAGGTSSNNFFGFLSAGMTLPLPKVSMVRSWLAE